MNLGGHGFGLESSSFKSVESGFELPLDAVPELNSSADLNGNIVTVRDLSFAFTEGNTPAKETETVGVTYSESPSAIVAPETVGIATNSNSVSTISKFLESSKPPVNALKIVVKTPFDDIKLDVEFDQSDVKMGPEGGLQNSGADPASDPVLAPPRV